MEEETVSPDSKMKKHWKDYFDVFKYFIPFFVYFIIIWLDNNYASTDDLTQVKVAISDNSYNILITQESTKDLRTETFYEVRMIDEKLMAIAEDLGEIKKIVEQK